MAALTGIGLTSENSASTRGSDFICICRAFSRSPSRNAWHISCVSCGAILEITEITPIAPIAISGTTSPSSPEYITYLSPQRLYISGTCAKLHSLTPTMFSQSESLKRSSGEIFTFVLEGTLLAFFGAIIAAAGIIGAYFPGITLLQANLPFLRASLITEKSVIWRFCGLLAGFGATLGWVCSYIVVARFINSITRPE